MDNERFVLELNSVSKIYASPEGPVSALTDLSMAVCQGDIVGLLGPNGAGKTTAVKLIMGFMHPTRGTISFLKQQLKVAEPRKQIGFLPESFQPNPNLTVGEYITLLCSLSGTLRTRSRRQEIHNLLDFVGMDRFYNRRISALSKGMGRRLGLAQSFAGGPRCLVLDEPTSGLDPIGRSEIMAMMREMKNRGTSILFCSHILSEVEKICDRIGILVDGRLKFFGTVPEFLDKWNTSEMDDAFKQEVLSGRDS